MSSGTNQERLQQNNQELQNIKNIIDTIPNTNDATAQSNEIIAPKTAYVKDKKITGTIIPTYTTSGISDLNTSPQLPVYPSSYSGYGKNINSYRIIDYNERYNIILTAKVSGNGGGLCLLEYNSDFSVKSEFELSISVGQFHRASLSNYYDPDYWYLLCITYDQYISYSGHYQYARIYKISKTTGEVITCGQYQLSKMFLSNITNNIGDSLVKLNAGKLIPYNGTEKLGWVYLDLYTNSGNYVESSYIYSLDGGITVNYLPLNLDSKSYGGDYDGSKTNYTGYFTEDGLFSMYLKLCTTIDDVETYKYYFNTIDLSNNTKVNLLVREDDTNYLHPINRNIYCDKNYVYSASDLTTPIGTITSPIIINENITVLSNKYMVLYYNYNIYVYELDNNDIVCINTYPINYAFRVLSDVSSGIVCIVNANGGSVDDAIPKAISYITVGNTNNLMSLEKDGKIFANTTDANVTPADVLKDKLFTYNSLGVTKGTMPNNGTLNYMPSNEAQIIPAGYTTGGTISAIDITSLAEYQACDALADEILGEIEEE